MLIYNVTINIDDTVHDSWLDWMKEVHIPEVLATGKFMEARMTRVLVEEETGGTTYSIQYLSKDRETLEAYYKEDAPRLREDGQKLFANKFVAFRTELEVISEQKQASNSATEFLFTYGTLQDSPTQIAVFSRSLQGKDAVLPGHKIATELIAGLYPSVTRSDNASDSVQGKVYAISGMELLKADTYEGSAYHRKKVVLESGLRAWVYYGRSMG
ncbi:DUF4286 family protein [Poritiphilus flavus]|uniref:DUF4286 family protein n=1 Tax=Poritiphilus flavus TaxID=2697053 RepID=A0A6L9E7S0_9FLAO|nr:DUF4286 family protein [Poritiphilus flavus]NAS10652.1 DUF4286 family protein [Poritiphilus flavus]